MKKFLVVVMVVVISLSFFPRMTHASSNWEGIAVGAIITGFLLGTTTRRYNTYYNNSPPPRRLYSNQQSPSSYQCYRVWYENVWGTDYYGNRYVQYRIRHRDRVSCR